MFLNDPTASRCESGDMARRLASKVVPPRTRAFGLTVVRSTDVHATLASGTPGERLSLEIELHVLLSHGLP